VYSTSSASRCGTELVAVALVDMDAGFRMMSNVVSMPADEVEIGMRVLVAVDQREGDAVPLFSALPR